MNVINFINSGAIALREVITKHNNIPDSIKPVELSKNAPYFGYIDIQISDNRPFTMFSANDDFVAKNFFWNGADSYEQMSLRIWSELAKKSRNIFDIGSYTGIYSLLAAIGNAKSKVYAFEALDVVYARLLINKASNKMGNLNCFNVVISELDGEIELSTKAGDSVLSTGSSVSRKVGGYKKVIKSKTLSSIISENEIKNLDLMKIDAEGAEPDIIRSSEAVLLQHSPDMIIEFLHDSNTESVSKILSDMGYLFYKINDKESTVIQTSTIVPSTSLHDLNTLVTKKTQNEIDQIVSSILK